LRIRSYWYLIRVSLIIGSLNRHPQIIVFIHFIVWKMADNEDDRYEDEELSDLAQDDVQPAADNHHDEPQQQTADDPIQTQSEVQQMTEDVLEVAASEQKFDDSASPGLHPPGETPEITERSSVPEENDQQNSISKIGEDDRSSYTSYSNLERYNWSH